MTKTAGNALAWVVLATATLVYTGWALAPSSGVTKAVCWTRTPLTSHVVRQTGRLSSASVRNTG